ncbi:aldo/keto reductase [Tissierella sp.]|uniref:aldo/keto reductase n=1 Tax=Tissierella sp. TaxID=41274 RepID=UPI00285754CC|nr:aldo/keto reductase [Tissierella sp.]MDR7857666.1 aldo/keto reductase [Tissierella sp.]
MQYCYFTKDKLKVSKLGFGCMRFPILEGDSGKIDKDLASKMLIYGIDNGINYIDTAYPYHKGNSEEFVGEVLSKGYREKVYLATKLPAWLTNSYEDFENYLDEQLKRLQTDYIDFYLLHSLSEKTWNKIYELNVLGFLDEAKRKGKIKYAGFSFHDNLDIFKTIVDSYPWDFCQIQLNYMDRQYQTGLEGMRYAAEKEISLVIMEPIKGGKLSNASEEISAIWNKSNIKRSPAEWALKWIYNFEEVSVVLSGMSTMDHVIENVKTANDAIPNSLTDQELKIVDEVTALYEKNVKVGCTSCEYCLPCPQKVSIPNIFELYNNIYVYGTETVSKDSYSRYIEQEIDASKCVECGACESVCPQHLDIIKHLKDADLVLK